MDCCSIIYIAYSLQPSYFYCKHKDHLKYKNCHMMQIQSDRVYASQTHLYSTFQGQKLQTVHQITQPHVINTVAWREPRSRDQGPHVRSLLTHKKAAEAWKSVDLCANFRACLHTFVIL